MTNVLETVLGPLTLKNPILVASGTFGYGVEYSDVMDISSIGGISVKGISLQPRPGNPPPRMCETPSGMLNSIGLANVGFDVFVTRMMPKLREQGATVIANAYGTSADEFAELCRKFNDVEGIAAIEVNISCPNVKSGGIHFGVSGKPAAEVTEAVRKATALPVIVKLSPEAFDIKEVARAVEAAGADSVSLINTFRGMSIDVNTRKPRLGVGFGGLSGPAVRPLAVRMVYDVAQAVRIPIIGMGGITCLRDVLEFFLAGASAVQVGTANFSNPTVAVELVRDLEQYCERNGVKPFDLVGKVQMP
ncbi:MAG: dihydroorotate dehydrogenase [Deltaproteobacteria bacterium]|nr:dihydroorotate dehydrogenase [Deltaproteobacteria bacterium]MBN2670584.1 dihydroorotate dehydrogenase [Deltaproteobacteria bacterium]